VDTDTSKARVIFHSSLLTYIRPCSRPSTATPRQTSHRPLRADIAGPAVHSPGVRPLTPRITTEFTELHGGKTRLATKTPCNSVPFVVIFPPTPVPSGPRRYAPCIRPPPPLAAGLKKNVTVDAGYSFISITMIPLGVDTEFAYVGKTFGAASGRRRRCRQRGIQRERWRRVASGPACRGVVVGGLPRGRVAGGSAGGDFPPKNTPKKNRAPYLSISEAKR
jgi:hypothetical protein